MLATGLLVAGGGGASAQTATPSAPVSFGSVNVGTAATPLAVTFNITAGGTLGTPLVLTQGAQNKDFTLASGGTCTGTVSVGTCTVNVAFTPAYPGVRLGAVVLLDGSGNTLATGLVSGYGVGPQVTYPSSTTISSLGSGVGNISGVAVDGSGNVYLASSGSPANVEEIVAVNGAVSSSSTIITLATGHTFNVPSSVTVDGAGDVFVADYLVTVVEEIVAVKGVVSASSSVVAVGSGFGHVHGIAFDASGDLFVTDSVNNAVYEIVAGTGGDAAGIVSSNSTVNTILSTGLNAPTGVAVDGNGNVFVADSANNLVKEIVAGTGGDAAGVVSPNSTVNTILSTGLNDPTGVAVDSAGDVFISDTNNNLVKEVVAGTGGNAVGVVSSSSTVNTIGSGYSKQNGLVVGGNGNVYVADDLNHVVKLVDLSDPPSFAFATPTTAGTTDTTDGSKVITLQNDGNATLNINIPTVAGSTNPSTAQDFTLNSSSGSACPLLFTSSSSAGMVASGGECTLTLSFTPLSTTIGSVSESMVMTDNTLNAAAATQTMPLTGTSVTGTIAILSSHSDPFTQGHIGSTYTLTPYNLSSSATSGTITVVDTLPSGFTATAMSGTGWTCTVSTVTCTSTTVISANSTGNAITLTVNVATTAVSGTNSVTISGGGSPTSATATDATTVNPAQTSYVVDSNLDSLTLGSCATGHTAGTCTLRTAITAANVANTTSNITFETDGAAGTTNFSTAQTITMAASALTLTASNLAVNITGPGQSLLSISEGGTGIYAEFYVNSSGGNITVSGMTFGNSKAPGVIIITTNANLTLTNVTVTGNAGTAAGAAVINNNTGTLTLNNCTITGNSITYSSSSTNSVVVTGAGVSNISNGKLYINNSTISGNTLSSTETSTGTATGEGAGVYNVGTAVITGSTIGSSSSPNTITASNSSTGLAIAYGGGIYNSGTLTLTNSSVSYNTVSATSTSAGKAMKAFGGGIYISSTTANVTMSGTTVSGNTATCTDTNGCTASGGGAFGGGIYSGAVMTLNGSSAANTISGNSVASGNSITTNIDGGGIYAANTMTLTGATVSGNSAPDNGGGIYFGTSGSTSWLTNVTISSTNGVGGVASFTSGNVRLNNVTLYNNTTTNGATAGLTSTNASTGANNILIGCAASACPSDSTEITSTNGLNLGPLQNNGGGVLTLLPGAGSTAIGAGSNCTTSTDERGYTRPTSSTCDAGAVRVATATATVTVSPASAATGASSVVLTASVTYTGSSAPTGAFSFTVNGSTVTANCSGSSSPLSCSGTFNPSALASNTYTITGALAGDASYDPATGTNTLSVTSAATPTVTGISPTTGTVLGGTSVTVTGTNLSGATAVNFGAVAGTITANTATTVTVTSPSGSVGVVDVTVTTPGGTSATSPADHFTYGTAGVFGSLTVTGYASPAVITEPGTVTVTAYDQNSNVDPYFAGTVTLTSSDAHATLPSPYTFTSADAGVHVFNVTLNTLGSQSITATSGSVTASQTGILVGDAIWVLNAAGTLDKLSRTGSLLTSSVGTSGTAASYGGTAFDSSGNVWSVTSAANSVLFTSNLAAGTTTKTGAGLSAPVAVAVDGAGYIWIANSVGNTVSEFTNAGVAQSNSSGYGSSYVTGEALSAPSSIAIDQTGGVWVTNKSGNTVTHIFGAAAPVVTPLSTATANGTLGTKP
jgi:hypothetical protein